VSGPDRRPDGSYILVGDHVIVPARVAAAITRQSPLREWAIAKRGIDPELDVVLGDLKTAGLRWVSSHGGTEHAEPAEPAPQSVWMTTTQVARQLQITGRAVRKAIAERRLEADKVNGQWLVRRESCEHWRTIRAA